jgi:hypothetical protein
MDGTQERPKGLTSQDSGNKTRENTMPDKNSWQHPKEMQHYRCILRTLIHTGGQQWPLNAS